MLRRNAAEGSQCPSVQLCTPAGAARRPAYSVRSEESSRAAAGVVDFGRTHRSRGERCCGATPREVPSADQINHRVRGGPLAGAICRRCRTNGTRERGVPGEESFTRRVSSPAARGERLLRRYAADGSWCRTVRVVPVRLQDVCPGRPAFSKESSPAAGLENACGRRPELATSGAQRPGWFFVPARLVPIAAWG